MAGEVIVTRKTIVNYTNEKGDIIGNAVVEIQDRHLHVTIKLDLAAAPLNIIRKFNEVLWVISEKSSEEFVE